MNVLNDKQIKENHGFVYPYNLLNVQPCSIDVRLGETMLVPDKGTRIMVGQQVPHYSETKISTRDYMALYPGDMVLGHTMESVTLPNNIMARFMGKSSLGRLGLLADVSMGHIAPGWNGVITLELANVGKLILDLAPGIFIGQLVFYYLDAAAENPYGAKGSAELVGKYQGAYTVEGSKI